MQLRVIKKVLVKLEFAAILSHLLQYSSNVPSIIHSAVWPPFKLHAKIFYHVLKSAFLHFVKIPV